MPIFKNFIHGAIIGIANIIPGVSGGTIALVLGIYERLIEAIHNISVDTVRIFLKIIRPSSTNRRLLGDEWKRIDATFLLTIAAGAILAIVALAELMTYLLREWHDPTYGFFFGLVLMSAVAPYRLIKRMRTPVIVCMILALALIISISSAVSGETLIEKAETKLQLALQSDLNPDDPPPSSDLGGTDIFHLMYMFLLGSISISAMILPGVSGSFVLLLLGGYFEVLQAIAEKDILLLAIFGSGLLTGVLLFTRLLNFLLKRFHDQTMGFLFGLVIGSLYLIWPFKTSVVVGAETQFTETIYLVNRWPASWGGSEWYTVLAAAVGVSLVALMLYIEQKR